jgi:glycosyltransferase involved in cell wall biosynthesis
MLAEIDQEPPALAGSPLRVLLVQTAPRRSSETDVARELLSALPASGPLAVMVLQGVAAPESSPESPASEFRVLRNTAVHELPIGSLGSPRRRWTEVAGKLWDFSHFLRSRPQLLAVARDFRPHLVYSAQQRWDLRLATPLAQQLGVPQVIHLHYNCAYLGQTVIEDLKRATLVIAVSDFIRADAIAHGVRADRVHTLHNSVTLPALSTGERDRNRARLCAELRIDEPSLLVGIVARLAPRKGQVDLVDAMLPICREDPRVHLLVAGAEYPRANGMSSRIAIAAADAGLQGQVHLLGWRADAADIMRSLDVYAQPSRAEPFSLSVLQAQANGVPVVAWGEGGPAEIVADGETGLLVPPMRIDALGGAIKRLLDDDDLRRRLGAAARRRAGNYFGPDRASAGFVSLLQAAVR